MTSFDRCNRYPNEWLGCGLVVDVVAHRIQVVDTTARWEDHKFCSLVFGQKHWLNRIEVRKGT
jgi:hypothetical protein